LGTGLTASIIRSDYGLSELASGEGRAGEPQNATLARYIVDGSSIVDNHNIASGLTDARKDVIIKQLCGYMIDNFFIVRDEKSKITKKKDLVITDEMLGTVVQEDKIFINRR
jgi:hypothetical protein